MGDPIRVTYLRNGFRQTTEAPIRSEAATRQEEAPCPDEQTEEPVVASPEAEPTSVAVAMEEVEKEEAEAMEREKGIDMPLINDLSIEKLDVFPNPNNGQFTLRFQLPTPGATYIRIFNASGRQVYSYELSNFTGVFEDRIDLTNAFAGTYFLMVQQGDQSLVKKVIITR